MTTDSRVAEAQTGSNMSATPGAVTAVSVHDVHSATVSAHAKINLRLAILARETSGYHTIETIFHRLALADTVRVALREDGAREVQCSVDVGPMTDNLAYRAGVAYCEAMRWSTGFVIEIEKRIPARGGLGGGSADAAAVLRALHALHIHHGTPCTHSILLEIAGRLGADVPFLTTDATMALAWGRGDRLLALDPLPTRWVALITPDVGIGTAEAYQWVAESRQKGGAYRATSMALRSWQLANWSELLPLVHNDFTAVVAERYPFVAKGVKALQEAGAVVAEMSGSGSTLFGIFEREPDREAIARIAGAPVLVTTTATGGARAQVST